MLNSSDNQLVQKNDSSMPSWELALIIVLPGLFIFTLAIVIFCFYCKKDLKDMMSVSKIDEEE